MLVEDSEDAATLVQYAFQEYGEGRYRLVWTSNLGAGVEQLVEGGVDIVLLDLGLPDSSGLACFESVRERAPKVPVVVLTGDASAEMELTVLASGAEDYLIKDEFSGPLLMQTVQTALAVSKRPNDWRLSHRFRKNSLL